MRSNQAPIIGGMKNRRNYYRVLQVQPDAPVEVIRASYKTLMRELRQHPDLGGDLWNAQVLNEAHETLVDAEARQKYDRQLFERYTKKQVYGAADKTPLITIFCPFCKRPLARTARAGESCPSCKSPLSYVRDKVFDAACRRAIPRISRSGKFLYYTTWPQKGKDGEMIDLSKDGMRFRCSERLKDTMLIKISGPLLKGVARVTNLHKIQFEGYSLFSVGTRFVSVTFKEPRGGFCSSSA